MDYSGLRKATEMVDLSAESSRQAKPSDIKFFYQGNTLPWWISKIYKFVYIKENMKSAFIFDILLWIVYKIKICKYNINKVILYSIHFVINNSSNDNRKNISDNPDNVLSAKWWGKH